MPNSSVLAYGKEGATVKAWCLTGFNLNTTILGSDNFINGFNLRIDDAVMQARANAIGMSQQAVSSGGPIRFSFVTPMRNNKYKIFVSPRTVSSSASTGYCDSGRAFFAHAVNSAEYKKETTGFWIRFGMLLRGQGYDSFYDTGNISTSIVNAAGVTLEQGTILNRWNASGYYQLQVVVI